MKMFRKYWAPVKFQVSLTTLFNPGFNEDFKTERQVIPKCNGSSGPKSSTVKHKTSHRITCSAATTVLVHISP